MKRNLAWMILALSAVMVIWAPAVRAADDNKAAPAAKAKADDDYEKNMEKARAAAEDLAKKAKAAKEAEDKKKAVEAAEQKLKEQNDSAEKAKRAEEDAKRLEEQKRLAKIEEQKRQKIERERSCQIKPVMTDAEIQNCKKVWR